MRVRLTGIFSSCLAFGYLPLTVVSMVLIFLGPFAHDASEFNYPVLVLLVTLYVPILRFSLKLIDDLGRSQVRRGMSQLIIGFFIALLVWYLATFAWSELREDYFESAIILGVMVDGS